MCYTDSVRSVGVDVTAVNFAVRIAVTVCSCSVIHGNHAGYCLVQKDGIGKVNLAVQIGVAVQHLGRQRRFCGFGGLRGLHGSACGVEQLLSEAPSGAHSEYGVLLLMGGCVSWACGTLYSKYSSSAEEAVGGLAGAAWQMVAASVVFGLFACATGGSAEVKLSEVSTGTWLSLVYLIIFGSLMAYTAYVWLLKVRPASEVATHAYVNPVVAVVLGAGLGGERVTAVQLAGLAVILLSVMLVNRRGRQACG